MTGELKAKLEKAAAYIIETSARETSSGNWIMYPDDIPAEIISANLYKKHLGDIVEIMREYEAVAEAVTGCDSHLLDIIIYLDYCPNFEPDADERDEYPDDRAILDPLASRRAKGIPVNTAKREAEPRPTLMERLEAGKRKAARQDNSGNGAHKPKKREERT